MVCLNTHASKAAGSSPTTGVADKPLVENASTGIAYSFARLVLGMNEPNSLPIQLAVDCTSLWVCESVSVRVCLHTVVLTFTLCLCLFVRVFQRCEV